MASKRTFRSPRDKKKYKRVLHIVQNPMSFELGIRESGDAFMFMAPTSGKIDDMVLRIGSCDDDASVSISLESEAQTINTPVNSGINILSIDAVMSTGKILTVAFKGNFVGVFVGLMFSPDKSRNMEEVPA